MTRQVAITGHVRDQAGARFGITDPDELDTLVTRDVQKGQRFNHKPKPFRLYRQGRGHAALLGNQRFVVSSDGERGYVVDQQDDRDVVITAMVRQARL